MTTYLVTGGTGFLGRHLVELLTARDDAKVLVLVREGSVAKLARLGDHVEPLIGDLTEPLLGVSAADRERLRDQVDHFVHLAALYDMTADAETNEITNVGGTNEALLLASDLHAKRFHHVSSVAVAGEYDGTFTEDMFDEGQHLPSPYHATKFAAEQLVR
ncbi:MAG: SDR family oxidoreductase, partial [Mycobacteriales bacterium]